ncbi:MAG: heavy metal translocating P-type ATPase [Halobacteriales archaeon]
MTGSTGDDTRSARGREGATSTDAEATVRLDVPEMDCPTCAQKVESSVGSLEGVSSVDPRVTSGTVAVTYDDRTTPEAIAERVERAGYAVVDGPEPVGPEGSVWTGSRAVKTWISGLLVGLGLLFAFALATNPAVATVLGRELVLADVLFLVAAAVAGQVIFRNGYYSLRNRNLDIDLLMSIAILGAVAAGLGFGESLYFEAATLAFLFSVAELLEASAMERARTSLRELLALSPAEATVIRDGREVTLPVEAVVVGDVVAVRPGEKVPMDGVVREGASAVDQAPITGESVPVDKVVGDEVYAGTINESGYLEVEVTSAAGENTIDRIVSLVEDAEAARTDREQFVDRFAGYYTPVVVALGVLLAVVPPLAVGASWPTYVVYGLTLLVLACPCAFVISTPVSVVSGVTSAAKHGVLIKGGRYLEAMGGVGAVALDKTGTLTTGELTVTDVVPLNGNTEADVLRCARGLEARSEHPLGQAIVERAAAEGVSGREAEAFENLTGEGVRAELDGTVHYAGKPALFEDLGFDLTHVHATTDGGVVTTRSRQLCERNDCVDLLEETIPALQAAGKTVVLVGTDDELEGVIAVADRVRPGAAEAVARLRALGIDRVVMLTGDNERTARAIAEAVGIDEVRAGLLPEAKVEAVRELEAEVDGGVAMVGDGVNDAPALATATVGVAMGAAGTDTAIETADVALMADDLSRLPYLYDLAHRANGVIRQNVGASLAVKAALVVGVPFGLVPIWVAVLLGDVGMTVGVTGNAMRLARVEPA